MVVFIILAKSCLFLFDFRSVQELSRMNQLKLFISLVAIIIHGTAFCFKTIGSPKFVCVQNKSWHSQDCKALEYYLDYSSGSHRILNNTTLRFSPGSHNLTRPHNITGVFNLTLTPDVAGSTVVIQCESDNAGIAFFNVTGLTIEGIAVYNCGMHVPDIMKNRSLKAALVFIGGQDLILHSISASGSLVAAISLVDVTGQNVIKRSVFANASIPEGNKDYLKGNFIGYSKNSETGAAAVEISDTRFENNKYHPRYAACNSTDRRLSFGLNIILERGNVSIGLSNVTLSHNDGCAGGNMAILLFNFYNLVDNTRIRLDNGTIVEHGRGNLGGGIFVTLINSEDMPSQSSHATRKESYPPLHIHNTIFRNNEAYFVGGAIYLKHLETDHSTSAGIVSIENCTFEGNQINTTTSGGLALHITTFIVREIQLHTRPQIKVVISHCNFTGHKSQHSSDLGNGVIFVKTSPYISISDSRVTGNNCTGILAITSNIVISREVNVSNNTAYSGGGLLLCAGAALYLERGSHLVIIGNHAMSTGGGIYVERECIINRPRCFFQYNSTAHENSTTDRPRVTVKRNTAERAGDNIYGGTVDNCYLINISKRQILEIFKNIFDVDYNIISSKMQNSSIASPPRRVCQLYKANKIECSHINEEVYPGETLHIYNVVILGQLNGSVPGTVYMHTSTKFSKFIPKDKAVQTIPTRKPQQLSYRIYSKKENITVKLYLKVNQIKSGHNTAPLVLQVMIKPCPLGFAIHRQNTQSKCSCDKLRPYSRKPLRCSISRKVGIEYRPPTWIGMVERHNGSSLFVAVSKTCPQDYCNDTEKIFLDLKTLRVNSTIQCYFNRTGVLCGGCIEGYSMLLGSSKCSQSCSNYYLFLLPVFGLAGLALVFLLTFLNLTVTEGTINGLIFYANIVQIYTFFIFEKNGSVFAQVLKVFISWLNLDFGIESCFFMGMDSFAKTLLQFVFPLYIWIIAGAIIWLNRYALIAKICGKNSVKVLATLILLSYSKILRASVDSLHFTAVHYMSQNGAVEHHLHWTIDGRLRYFDGKHSLVFFVGVIFAVATFPFTLTLLCIQKIGLISNWPCFCWVHRLKPFFDSYTGPFTDGGRFWVGFLLLIRIIIMALFSFNFNNSDTIVIAAIILVCFFLLVIATLLPKGVYKKNKHNSLETFFIANLGCLCLGLLCSVYYNSELVKICTVNISIGLSLILFLLILCWHIFVKLKCQATVHRFKWRRHHQYHECHNYVDSERRCDNTLSQQFCSSFSNKETEPLLSSID